MKKKIVVGMSGGVDSSVTAALLKKQGYEVTGVFIEAYNEPGCRTDEDKKDALKVALQLGIPFQALDLRKEYKEKVVNYFFETYERGATPNPDVVCNREVKMGLFYEWALKNGFKGIATGHYARIYQDKYIQRAVDQSKDQSYFLWQVAPSRLKNVIFPLGSMTKTEVREKAKQWGLPNAEKADSMGVCMMGELNVREFLKKQLGEKPGEVVMEGKKVGSHRGLWFHTIGQRGGFVLDKKLLKEMGLKPEEMAPLYVVGKEVEGNRLIVGRREQVKRNNFTMTNYELRASVSQLRVDLSKGKLFVRIRNLGELEQVEAMEVEKEAIKIKTKETLFGVAEGQAAVLYTRGDLAEGEEMVVAGGEISV